MLYIVSGSVGSGKTLQQIRVIMDKLLNGENVISNIDFHYDVFCQYCMSQKNLREKKLGNYIFQEYLVPDYLVHYAHSFHDLSEDAKENQTLLIIDESSEYFNNREWNRFDRKPWIQFLEHLRKLKYAVIIIIQDWEDVDAKIIRKAEYLEEHKKVNNINGIGIILNMLKIELFITVTKWNRGGMRIIKKEYFTYKKLYGQLYNTTQMLNEVKKLFDKFKDKPLEIPVINEQQKYLQQIREEYYKNIQAEKENRKKRLHILKVNFQNYIKRLIGKGERSEPY